MLSPAWATRDKWPPGAEQVTGFLELTQVTHYSTCLFQLLSPGQMAVSPLQRVRG